MRRDETGFRAPLVARIIGVDYGRLDYWARTGFLKPSVVDAEGKGTRRVYSFADLVALKVAKALRDEGVSLQKLRRVVAYLQERHQELEQPLAGVVLVTDGKRVFEMTSDRNTLVDLLSRGQVIWAVSMQKVVAALRKTIRKEAPAASSAPAAVPPVAEDLPAAG